MTAQSRLSVDALIDALQEKGTTFRAEGENLRVFAPKDVLSPDDQRQIRLHKPAILAALGAGEAPPDRDIPRAEKKESRQLGYLQERIWSHQQMFPDLPLYNLANAWRMHGALDANALERAFNVVIERHETLRSRFSNIDGAPFVSFKAHKPVPLQAERLDQGLSHQQLIALLDGLRDAPLDLKSGETFRARLFRFSPQDHLFFFAPHHIVWDGLSWDIFLNDLSIAYERETGASNRRLPDLARQYVDFAEWQRDWMATPALERETDYWRPYYSEETPALALPCDVERPRLFNYEGGAVVFPVGASTHAGVKAIAAQQKCTVFVVYLAAWQAFLSRFSGNDDIVISAPVQGRRHEDFEDLIGCFSNVLGVRQIMSRDIPFTDHVRRTRDEFLHVFERQQAPMEHLAAELRGFSDLTRTALSQAMFTHQNESTRATSIGDIDLELVNLAPGGAQTDIRLEIIETEDDALAEINYASAAMSDRAGAYLSACFEAFLGDLGARPDAPLSDLAIMPEAERLKIVKDWNGTARDYRRDGLAHDYFDAMAARYGDKTALRLADEAISYRDLQSRADQLAHHLRESGVREGDIVALCLDRSLDMVAGIFAIWKAGAAMLPLDPEFPKDRLAYMIDDARARAVLTATPLIEDWLRDSAPLLDILAEADAIAARPRSAPEIDRARAAERAYVIYTSGSTGKPKGVENTHSALCNFLESMIIEPGADYTDKLLAVTTVSFDIMLLELFVPLAVGGEVILASDDDAMDGFALAELIEQHGVTVFQGTPATWRILLDSGWEGAPAMKGLCGGEAMPAPLANSLSGMIGELWNMYGPTETTVWSSCARIEAGEPVHVGRPIANTQIYILDAAGAPVPVGVAGELWIGGDGVARGYLGKPSLTAERFRDNPFDPGRGRIYNTGDRAAWRHDGTIEIRGRLDEQVKIRGYRIELGDIEAALTRHPAVRHGAAAVRQDSSGEASLVAYVVFEDGHNPTNSELRRFMRDQLPHYMVPQFFTTLTELPLTANNKINRKALPAPSAGPVLKTRTPPRTEAEKSLAALWRDILNMEAVCVTDNFLELGGQSLQVARLVALARNNLGLTLSPRAVIFETLEQLAADRNHARAAEAG